MDSKWTLRLTALGLALLLFFTVRSELNPAQTEGRVDNQGSFEILRDVPLEVFYDDATLIVTGMPETVDVTIQGSSKDVTQATLFKDFTVFADLESLSIGQHQVALQHENLSDNLTVTIEPALVEVAIDEKVSKEFTIEPEINTRLIGENYSLRSIQVSPNKVLVTGAKTVVESINAVKATASPDEVINDDFTQLVNVKVLDRDLNRLNVTTSPEQVRVDVSLEPYSKRVPLVLSEQGELPDGLTLEHISLQQQSAKLYGTKSFIESLAEYAIEVDLSKIKQSGTQKITIPLKDGVTSVEPTSVTVEIDVAEKEEG